MSAGYTAAAGLNIRGGRDHTVIFFGQSSMRCAGQARLDGWASSVRSGWLGAGRRPYSVGMSATSGFPSSVDVPERPTRRRQYYGQLTERRWRRLPLPGRDR